MSTTARDASEAETQGSQSSERGVIPSHPVEFNDSDLEGASRSVSPEPLSQKRGASHLATTQGGGSQSAAGDSQSAARNSPYPEGYSADGIPPEIHPEIQSVILTDKVTPAERVAATSPAAETHVSSEPAGTTTHHHSQGHTPSSVKDSVPATTDQGVADVTTGSAQSAGGAYDTEGAGAYKTEGTAQPSTPSSQSQSSGFFSRILGGLMPSSNPTPATEGTQGTLTTRTSNFSNQPLSASWGQAAPAEPVEQIRQAGSTRAEATGLDEPTATKQAGLDGAAGGNSTRGDTSSTAVAAAESLADTKADREQDTAATNLHMPRSQGRSESEYYGTPQASPDQGRYAGDNSNRSPDKSSLGSSATQPIQSSTYVEPHYAQPYGESGTASNLPSQHDTDRKLDRDLNQTASFETAHSTDDHTRAEENQPGVLGTVLGAVGLDGSNATGGARLEPSNVQQASTSPALENELKQQNESKQASSPGVIGSVLGAVGLDGSDSTVASQPAAHSQAGSSQGNQGALGSIKEAVGLGNNTSSSAGRWDRPAWATAGATAGGTADTSRNLPSSAQQGSYGQSYGSATSVGESSAAGQGYASQQPSAQEHKYGQPYEQSDTYKQLSQGNRQNQSAGQYGSSNTGYTDTESAQTVRPDQGAGLANQVKAAIGSSNTSGTGTQGSSQNRQYDEPTGQYGSSAGYGGASEGQGVTQAYQDSGRLQSDNQSDNQYNSSDRAYSGSSAGQGTGIVDKLKSAVGISNEPSTHTGYSSSTNPVYGSDSPRSVTGTGPTLQPSRSRLSNAPPSASWGNTKFTSYEPAESVTHGGYTGGAEGYSGTGGGYSGTGGGYSGGVGGKEGYTAPAAVSTGSYQGSSAAQDSSGVPRPESPVKRAVSQFEGRAIGERPVTSHTATTGTHQGTTPEQETKAKLSTESPVKKAVSEYEGRAVGDRPHGPSTGAGAVTGTGAAAVASGQQKPESSQAASTESPRATAGIRGKTPVEESSQAFTEDTPSAAKLSTAGPAGAAGPEVAAPKLGTTALQHASVRSPGSPTGRSAAAAAGTDSAAGSSAGVGQTGKATPSFGTTAAEHALSRTSGQPLGRVSGTPSSPPTSFRKSLGARPDDTTALPESTRTTADLPVSTNAPPASARTTQESPAEVAAASTGAGTAKTSQPDTISEATTDGQKTVPPVGKPATETTKPTSVVDKAAADGKQVGSGSGTTGTGPSQAAPSPTGAVSTQRPAAAANTSTAGAKKPNKGIANCFACFGAASAKE